MSKPRLLQLCPLSPALDAALADTYEVQTWWELDDPTAFLAASGAGIRGVVTGAQIGLPQEVLDGLPDLEVVSCRGVGMDKIDLDQTKARGIAVAGSFGTLNDCVADTAMGLLIDAARQLSASDRYVRAGRWEQARYPLATRVSGKRLGILGLGNIGRVIARRASGFDMDIRYTTRAPVEDVDFVYEPDLRALARWCDFLVVAVSGGPATRHLVSADVLDALGPGGFLVNIARGSIVDEAALVAALQAGRIAGAGMDVFEDEPHVPSTLLAMDNVVLTPHLGSGTRETRKVMEDLVLANLISHFKEGRLLSPA